MVYCVVPFCKSSSRKKDAGTSFHEFPVDTKLCHRWRILIARKDFTINDKSASSVVCSKHFLSSDFTPGLKIRRLNKYAVPTVFPFYPSNRVPPAPSNRRDLVKACSKRPGFEDAAQNSPKKVCSSNGVLNSEFMKNSQNQSPSKSSSLKNEARTNFLMPLGNSTKNSTTQSATDTEEWTSEETPQVVGSTFSGQLAQINIPSNTATVLSKTNMKQLKSNVTQITANSSNILRQMTENKHLPKIPAVQTFFYPNKQKIYKGTQTKLTSSIIVNQKAELKQVRMQLMKKHRDNESLRNKLQEKSDKLECYENNALLKNVAKMQALYHEGLASKQIEFTLNQISNFERKNPCWSDSVLRECVFLQATSPKGYEALRDRKLLRLPGRRTLNKFLQPTTINNQDELSDTNFELTTTNNQDELSDTNFEM